MQIELKINEFKLSVLTVLEKINLDPVFDYSQADEAAQKIIDEIFNDENAGKNFLKSYLKINYMKKT